MPTPDSASSPGDQEAAGAADGEDGDERGEAHYGEGRGNARDVAAPGGQREGAGGHGRGALRPALAGGEQRDSRAQRTGQQGDGEAEAAGPAGEGGFGTRKRHGYGYGSHVPHRYLPEPRVNRHPGLT